MATVSSTAVGVSDMNRALDDLTGADVNAAAEPARDAMSASFMFEVMLLLIGVVNCEPYAVIL